MGTFGEEERDMLITIAVNVKNICKKQDVMASQIEDKVAKGVWMWVTGGMCALFMALIVGCFTYTNNVDRYLSSHVTKLEIHKTIESGGK